MWTQKRLQFNQGLDHNDHNTSNKLLYTTSRLLHGPEKMHISVHNLPSGHCDAAKQGWYYVFHPQILWKSL